MVQAQLTKIRYLQYVSQRETDSVVCSVGFCVMLESCLMKCSKEMLCHGRR